MVSKVAVIALVAIIATPILLGYGLNLSEVTYTDYKNDGEPVNVTPLLKNDTAYTTAYADTYKVNTHFTMLPWTPLMPIYSVGTDKSSLPMYYQTYNAGQYPTDSNTLATWNYMFFAQHNDGAGSVSCQVIRISDNLVYQNISNIIYWHWDLLTKTLNIYTTGNITHSIPIEDPTNFKYVFSASADYSCTGYLERSWIYGESTSADISKGYYFNKPYGLIEISLPEKTKAFLMTLDLNSITTDPYYFRIIFDQLHIVLVKEIYNGQMRWYLIDNDANRLTDDIYYDPSASSNTYQIYISMDKIKTDPDPNDPSQKIYTFNNHIELRYVGNWPTLIGAANYYKKYDVDYQTTSNQDIGVSSVQIGDRFQYLPRTPLMRIDQAKFAAFAYDVISDKTYIPSDFKTNPTTTINVSKPGSSIVFGGITYAVDSSGNITLGSHKVPVNGMQFTSVPVSEGYENRIGNTVISTTLTPSTIKFVGEWGASISTIANVSTTYTKTEWTPGEFAWNGIDQNFLMIGLLAALGAFIALGIAYRKVKSALFALLVVCGGAVVLFFTML